MCDKQGKPIYTGYGIEQATEQDYAGSGANALQFTRTYNSVRVGSNYRWPVADTLSTGWTHNYSKVIRTLSNATQNVALVYRSNGNVIFFTKTSGVWVADADITGKLTQQVDGSGNTTGWQYTAAGNEDVETYDAKGRLITIVNRTGRTQTLSYDAVTGLLTNVTDNFGHQLNFSYDSGYRLHTMTDSAGGVYTYSYNNSNQLSSVQYPNSVTKSYRYDETGYVTSTSAGALTGIIDEKGNRFASIHYTSGKAISTELSGGVYKYSFAFGTNQTTVTDPLGTNRVYNFSTVLNVVRRSGQNQPAGSGCGASSSGVTYDANGNVASQTDFNGNVTTYTYDLTRDLETQRVEASGTALARTISTQWHATYDLPLAIAEPEKLTTYTYDTAGNMLTRTEQATTDTNGSSSFSATTTGTARTWTYTYNSVGQVLTVDGPRTDVTDVTTLTYDTSGNLASITDAASNVTTFSSYDANGRAGHIVGPDGHITDLTYNTRGWLTQSAASDGTHTQTTGYAYDNIGQLTTLTLPDGGTLAYTYDNAHRLTDITDNLGNTVHYVLDNMGNRTTEQVKDPGGTLTRQITRFYDALNRLQTITGGVQ